MSITGLDHIVLLAPDADIARSTYTVLLGIGPDWVSRSDGVETQLWTLSNGALEIMAPCGDSDAADHLRQNIERDGAGLKSMVLRSNDLSSDHSMLARRALKPGDITDGSSSHVDTGQQKSWRRFRCEDAASNGLKVFVIEPFDVAPLPKPASDPARVDRIDHLVVQTSQPDRAVAFFGGRLGFRLALDKSFPDWGMRLIFFREGDLTFEVAASLKEDASVSAYDKLWGVTWNVDDLDAAHARLIANDIAVSPIRTGRRPGSKVFSVKGDTLGVPTLFISHMTR